MSIENLISSLKDSDNIAAGKAFDSIMADKMSAALDAKKIEVASSLQDRQTDNNEDQE